MSYPENYRYTKDHEWIETGDGTARVGLTEHAQHELGDIVFVELPEVGRTIARGEAFGVVESVKAVSDCYMPVGGKVVEVNEALSDNPALVNESPHDGGWIVKLEVTDASELDELMSADAYEQYLKDNA